MFSSCFGNLEIFETIQTRGLPGKVVIFDIFVMILLHFGPNFGHLILSFLRLYRRVISRNFVNWTAQKNV